MWTDSQKMEKENAPSSQPRSEGKGCWWLQTGAERSTGPHPIKNNVEKDANFIEKGKKGPQLFQPGWAAGLPTSAAARPRLPGTAATKPSLEPQPHLRAAAAAAAAQRQNSAAGPGRVGSFSPTGVAVTQQSRSCQFPSRAHARPAWRPPPPPPTLRWRPGRCLAPQSGQKYCCA